MYIYIYTYELSKGSVIPGCAYNDEDESENDVDDDDNVVIVIIVNPLSLFILYHTIPYHVVALLSNKFSDGFFLFFFSISISPPKKKTPPL